MRTTPSPPVDVAALLPDLAPLARTTVRLHPRPGDPAAGESSLGGPLLWPAGEPWPMCDGPKGYDHFDEPAEAEVPLAPVLQILAEDVPELPFPDDADVLQVLWCPFDHEPFSSPRPQVRWRRRSEIGEVLAVTPAPDEEAQERHLPDPCVLHPERVVEYPSWDLPDELWDEIARMDEATGESYENDLSVASGTKIGGYPGWTQNPHWPVCECGSRMEHLLTVASWEFSRGDEKRWIPVEDRPAMAGWTWDAADDHPSKPIQNPAGLMLGDVGGIYLFMCVTCPQRTVDYRFDCS
ncbi:hypothetical protein AB0M02_43620 [Actinoplanes sp. NPDC051861]|uniref:hypothetical protein n=1 Tax=Actinoplanes sp. NPDC051861 TaxID=3155170 RepID=UPI00341EA354